MRARMSAEATRPPPFYCPACGKKHRADLRALQDRADATARVACARCEAVMSLRMGEDGLPTCEILEPSPHDAPATASPDTVLQDAGTNGDPMSKSNLSLSVLVAAVVAALVSFGVGRLTAAEPGAAPRDDKAFEKLRREVDMLTAKLAAEQGRAQQAIEIASKAVAKVGTTQAWAEAGVRANAAKVTGLEKAQAAISKAFEQTKADYKALNGRIEGNYTNLRGLTKRVKKLEGN